MLTSGSAICLSVGAALGVHLGSAFVAPSIPVGRQLSASSRASQGFTIMSSGKALIAQNKGGGHGELGYHLALKLIEKDISVTLLQDGAGKNKGNQPFASYGDLESKGATIVWGDFSEGVGKLIPKGESFDYVFDNYAKDVDTCKDLADCSKAWGVKNFAYVSSGGMYKDSDEVPFTESSDVKESGQRQVEKYVADLGLPWTSFRPQYIYGPLTNKRDYLDWFFDRVVHGLEFIPLPLHGDQLVALTHAEDVASMLASVVGNERAVNQVFNCASDRYITYNGLFREVGKVAKPTVSKMAYYYEPRDYDLKKGWFPFRNNHFVVNSEKAKRLLGWSPKHTITDDLTEYFEGYKAAGKVEAEPNFNKDDEINMSWNMEYVPYMARLEYRRRFPDLDEEMAELEKTYQPGDRHFNSAILDSMKEEYRNAFPDEPDIGAQERAQAQAEYDAYMAAHPGLKEQLIQQEEEEAVASIPQDVLNRIEGMLSEEDDGTVVMLD
ncbi:unnamed protein product [Ectocarpus fasciculatus]